jgi:hypothetical protein
VTADGGESEGSETGGADDGSSQADGGEADGSDPAGGHAGSDEPDGTSDGDTSGTTDSNDTIAIAVAAASFTLAWDPSAQASSGYELYYRTHGQSEWNLLGQVAESDSPSITVSDADLPYGTYDFAVRAVESDGSYSAYHTSLDQTAEPDSGWYLSWTAP